MNVTAAELNAIKAIAQSQMTISRLGSFENRDQIVGHTKRAKKVWWTTIRGRYHLDANKKYAVELDGDKAGELRLKKNSRKNGSSVASLTEAQRAEALNPKTSVASAASAAKDACAQVIGSINDAFAKAGLAFELKSK